jgi:micrococcal nuclease
MKAKKEPKHRYDYTATVLRIIDGDTVLLRIDLGFYVLIECNMRLLNVYAAETSQPDGPKHTAHLALLMPVDAEVTIMSHKPLTTDRYGRWLADIWLNGQHINAAMSAFIGTPQGKGLKQP